MLRSERGQIAIFIALIFQVLFVFFAMIVNIGLIVHDKINLQNSVDLAAYYAAQRQAEILNAIAHQNYQIRQAWKLLAFRVRVLGDLGYSGHPMKDYGDGVLQEVNVYGGSGGLPSRAPVICINHSLWGGNYQNLCHTDNLSIPGLPRDKPSIAPWVITSIISRVITREAAEVAGKDCEQTGPLNFNIAIRWARAYRSQIAKSKEVIRAYADNLSKDMEDFLDVRGDSVKGGALKTLENNLTRANLKSLKENTSQSFKFFNSLGGIPRRNWLNEVPIFPLILYANFTGGGTSNCTGRASYIHGVGSENLPLKGVTPSQEIDAFRNEPNDIHDLYHSIFGVEKNPWLMAYVGVYAETSPRKPYLPFGKPITLKAKAYAKPFGGRVGPWYYHVWPHGSLQSAGTIDQRVDALMPIPVDVSQSAQVTPDIEKAYGVPNYSRYPGDKLGLMSRTALTAFRKAIYDRKNANMTLHPGQYSSTPYGADGLALASAEGFGHFNNDSTLGYRAPWVRALEVAAVAPDLFDATYYSIDTNSYKNYIEPSLGKIFRAEGPPLDIGSFGINNLKNTADQISIMNQYAAPQQTAFWFIRDPQHLLTGWAPSGAFEYNLPQETFAKCNKAAQQDVPGKCAAGGRTGYSVKIISEEYLRSNLPLGGPGNTGTILNPPPESF